MAVELRLVQTGMSMQAGTIAAWFKDVGDPVTKGEVVGEVESEKSVLEILSPADGTLAAILVDVGMEVPVRTVLALIAGAGEEPDAVAGQRVGATVPLPASAPE